MGKWVSITGENFSFRQTKAKKTGHGGYRIAAAPRLFVGAVMVVCYAVESRFCRGRYQSLAHAGNAPGSPYKSSPFSPLLRNKGASFPHALGCLLPGDTLPAVRAVFDAVGSRRKGSSAHGTTPHIVSFEKLRRQFFIKGKYGNLKPLAEQRIGNKLRTYALVPVVKQNAVAFVAVAALFLYKGVYPPALGRRKPPNPGHTSSAA